MNDHQEVLKTAVCFARCADLRVLTGLETGAERKSHGWRERFKQIGRIGILRWIPVANVLRWFKLERWSPMGGDRGFSRKEFLSAWPHRALGVVQSWLEGRLAYLERDRAEATERRVAVLDITRCLAWGNFSCQLCYLACPRREQAIEFVDTKPVLKASECDGCALCVPACGTVNDLPAIKMVHAKGGGCHV